MKVAIVGCGFIAETHAQILNEMGIALRLCVDSEPEKAAVFAKKWKIPHAADNLQELLEQGIDAVHLCTPPNLHYQQAKWCLENGMHVFCEKPLCFENGQARELERLALEKQLVGAVGFNVRFHLACARIADLVREGALGRIYLIHGSYLQEFNAFPAPLDWRYQETLAGRMRAVTEIGSHWFDLAQAVSGESISAVSALFGNFNPERRLLDGMMYAPDGTASERVSVRSEDAAAISLQFANGAVGTVLLSEISQGRINRLKLEITGEDATVWWNSEENNRICIGRKSKGVTTEVLAFGNGFADTERLLFASVYEDIAKGKPSGQPQYPTFADGRRNVELCNAVYKSAVNGSAWEKL